MKINEKLQELNITLPAPPPKGGVYTPCIRFGENSKLCYVSGCGPNMNGSTIAGKLGAEFTIEEGQEYARACMLNVLSVLQDEIGDLNHVKQCVKLLVFVAGTSEFYSQPQVANHASSLLLEIIGHAPSRSAIGTNALPGNIPVEIEAIFELE